MGLFKPNVEKLKRRGDIGGLIKALKYKDKYIRNKAASALGEIGEPAVEPLISLVINFEEEGGVIRNVADTLIKIGKPAVEPLIKELESYLLIAKVGGTTQQGKAEFAVKLTATIIGTRSLEICREIIYCLGSIHDNRAVEPLSKALTLKFKAHGLNESLKDVRLQAAWALGEIGDEAAIEVLTPTLEGEKDGNLRRSIKNALKKIEEGDIRKMAAVGDTRAVEPSTSTRSWNEKGLALINLGKHEEAIKRFDSILDRNPKYANAWNNKGLALINTKKYSEAIECLNKALELNSRIDDAWINKGFALLNLGSFEEAIKCSDMALDINPKRSEAWNCKGTALASLERNEEAIICFKRFIELAPPEDARSVEVVKQVINRLAGR